MRRVARGVLAVVIAWFAEVMVLLMLYAVTGFDPADVAARFAPRGSGLYGLINTVMLLTPTVLMAPPIYRRL